MLTAIVAIIIFALLVSAHEFGHFITAKLFKVRVNEFAIGMGPAIFKKRSKKTGEIFALRTIPLGGYCAFDGEDGEELEEEKKAWGEVELEIEIEDSSSSQKNQSSSKKDTANSSSKAQNSSSSKEQSSSSSKEASSSSSKEQKEELSSLRGQRGKKPQASF